jgi:dTDP-4-dehydrorhamnose 3,5-epimerase-like enzyme
MRHIEIGLNHGTLTLSQSSLVMRFVNNDFQENKEPTIGGVYAPR